MATKKQVKKELLKRINDAEKHYTDQVLLYNTFGKYIYGEITYDQFFDIIKDMGECPPISILWCESKEDSLCECCDNCDLVRNNNICNMDCKVCWKRSLNKLTNKIGGK